MVYLIEQVFISLILAGLIGLSAGWLIWGLVVRRLKNEASEYDEKLQVLIPLPARLIEMEVKSKTALAAKDTHIETLSKQMKGLQGFQEKAAQLTKTIEERESQMFTLRARVTGLDLIEGERSRLEAALNDRTSELSAMQAQAEGHRQAMEEKDRELAILQGRVQELLPLTERVKDAGELLQIKETEFATLQNRVREQVARLTEAEALAHARESETAELRVRIEQLDGQHRAMAATHETRTRAIEPLRNALAEKDREIARLSVEKEAERAELSERMRELVLRHKSATAEMDAQASLLKGRIETLEMATVNVRGHAAGANASVDRPLAMPQNGSPIAAVSQPLSEAEIETRREEIVALMRRIQKEETELGLLRSIANVLTEPPPHDEVVRTAYSYAAARNFQGGSEHEDWVRAENEVRLRRAAQIHGGLDAENGRAELEH